MTTKLPEPVAWRVRGYAQFKTGRPGGWGFSNGTKRPAVNNPDCCDIEPLYTASQLAQVRREALEEAAKVVENTTIWNDHDQSEVIKAIRALAGKEGER